MFYVSHKKLLFVLDVTGFHPALCLLDEGERKFLTKLVFFIENTI
jgi:hypothetical protein